MRGLRSSTLVTLNSSYLFLVFKQLYKIAVALAALLCDGGAVKVFVALVAEVGVAGHCHTPGLGNQWKDFVAPRMHCYGVRGGCNK